MPEKIRWPWDESLDGKSLDLDRHSLALISRIIVISL